VREVYLDVENSGFVLPEVLEAMKPYYYVRGYGNPAIPHKPGQEALEVFDMVSEKVLEALNSDDGNIIFTADDTESNNLAIIGYSLANRRKGKRIIVSSIEHQSVLFPAEWLSKEFGFEVVKILVDSEGFVKIDELEKSITKDTILVSIGLGNYEIGTIQDLKAISEVVKDRNPETVIHSDATSAFTWVPIDPDKLGIDMITISSHKILGPKGVSALFARKGVRLGRILHGAVSTQPLRPGVENIPALAGFGKAIEIALSNWNERIRKVKGLRDTLMERILGEIDYTLLNGPRGDKRLPNNLNISFLYVEGEALTIELSLRGIYVATGSACTMRELEPSHVLIAIGRKHEEAHGSILFSLHSRLSREDIEYVIKQLKEAVNRLREISAWKPGKEVIKPGEIYRGGKHGK